MTHKIVWGWPCGRSIESEWLRRQLNWAYDSKFGGKWDFGVPVIASHSARVDLARSWIIQVTRETEDAEYMIQQDTDVSWMPNLNRNDVMKIVEEDVALGYDAIIAPTLSEGGRVMAWGGRAPVDDGPFDVDGGAGGAFIMTKAMCDRMKLVSYIEGPDSRFEVYCRQSERGTEDASLFQTVHDSGGRVGMDRRLAVSHRKAVDYFIDLRKWQEAKLDFVNTPPSIMGPQTYIPRKPR